MNTCQTILQRGLEWIHILVKLCKHTCSFKHLYYQTSSLTPTDIQHARIQYLIFHFPFIHLVPLIASSYFWLWWDAPKQKLYSNIIMKVTVLEMSYSGLYVCHLYLSIFVISSTCDINELLAKLRTWSTIVPPVNWNLSSQQANSVMVQWKHSYSFGNQELGQ